MTDYEKLKVTELKTLLKERGIAATGLTKKAQFIQALVEEDEKGAGESGAASGERDHEAEQQDTAAAAAAADNDATKVVAQETVDAQATDEVAADPPVTAADEVVPTIDESAALPAQGLEKADEPMAEPLPVEERDSVSAERKRKREDVPGEEEQAQESTPKKIRADEESNEVEAKPVPAQEQITLRNGSAINSRHAPTSALYIKNLMRPLQLSTFREHLESLAGNSGSGIITQLHLDAMKTHSFAVFESPSAARAVRDQLHDRVWPEESQRKALWVDFVPEDKVAAWIDQENNASRDTRFEVAYSEDADGVTIADLSEAGARAPPARQSATPQLQGQGVPGAPQGPRGQRQERNTPRDEPVEDQRAAEPPKQQQGGSFSKLDQYFSFTTAKPKIYFKPVAKELADRRVADLDRETSRDWQGGRAWNRSTRLAPIDQLRRYTFEDGDRVVDGGVDFGGFGKRQFAGGTGPFIPTGPPRGRGGRGGGGYRGGY